MSGRGIQFGGETSDGTPLKLRLGIGRDEVGGGTVGAAADTEPLPARRRRG